MHAIGLTGLIEELGLTVEPPAVRSSSGPVARRTREDAGRVDEIYPPPYDCGTLQDHLRFALKYEPIDLRIWQAVIKSLPESVIFDWVRDQPTSAYSRRAWYLFERLSGTQLPLPNATAPYAHLANSALQVVWGSDGKFAPHSERHRVRNNLLGTRKYCPLVRLTKRLRDHQKKNYGEDVRQLTIKVDPALFKRAADYLYLSETKSSYAIEGEKPATGREERFVALLTHAGENPIDSERALVALQQQIIQDARFAAQGWRSVQNYVSRTRWDFTQDIRYICPKPEDLPVLMKDWIETVKKTYGAGTTDPVVCASCAAFGFVYLHPFEDGNGRVHRFLIHHVLAQRGYSPPGVVFPVSAVILRRRKDYEAVLETISRLVNPLVEYRMDENDRMTVTNDTIDLYRYPDLTPHAELLYECIAETVEKDWPQELRFLTSFDAAFRAVQRIVDMPDAKISLIIRLVMQNGGRLSNGKRELFSFLTDAEIQSIEEAIRASMDL